MSNNRITSKDLQISFLIDGVDGVKDQLNQADTKPSKKVLTQALAK